MRFIVALAIFIAGAFSQAQANTVSNFDAYPFGYELTDTPAEIQRAAFASWQAASNAPSVACNFVTGVVTGTGTGPCTSGATCNGVADDSLAFAEFNAWALAWQATPRVGQIRLDINSGKTCEILNGNTITTGFEAKWWSTGIKNLLVMGYGATLGNGDGSGAASFFFGNRAGIQSGSGFFGSSNIWTARLNAVSAGSTTLVVTVADAAQAAILTANTWAVITGFDMQGVSSTPPNPGYFEYVYITSVVGTTITISAPLTNTYLSTWPLYSAGTPGSATDQGGPATLYVLDPNWDAVFEYRGLTINYQNQAVKSAGRSVTFRDTTWVGDSRCSNPSENITWSMISSDMTVCNIEADKIVDSFVLSNTTINGILFQSSSINLFQSSGSTIHSLQGTPKRAVLADTTIDVSFRPGALAHGRTDEVICTNCNLPAGIGYQGVFENQQNDGIQTTFTIAGGTITVPDTAWVNIEPPPTRWSMPGTNLFWAGQYDSETAFQIVGVTRVGSDTIITTTLPGSMNTWPTVPLQGGTVLGIKVHPAPKFTCTGCFGSDAAISANSAPAAAPLFSYGTRHITSWAWTSGFHFGQMVVWGNVASVTFALATPYNGSVNPFQFYCGNSTIHTSSPSSTATAYSPQIDMRTGPRTVTITPGGVTGNVAGDSDLPPPWADTWMLGGCDLSVQQSIAASLGSPAPDLTFTITTDQGVVNPFAMDDAEWSWLIGDNDNALWRQAI